MKNLPKHFNVPLMSHYESLTREVALKDRTPVSQAIEIIMILDGMWLTDFRCV